MESHFGTKDQNTGINVQVEAELHYRSDELNMWFESGLRIQEEHLAEAATFIENELLPTTRGDLWRRKPTRYRWR